MLLTFLFEFFGDDGFKNYLVIVPRIIGQIQGEKELHPLASEMQVLESFPESPPFFDLGSDLVSVHAFDYTKLF
mgnify:FL=1